jgi:hypothetical protein
VMKVRRSHVDTVYIKLGQNVVNVNIYLLQAETPYAAWRSNDECCCPRV